MHRCWNTRTFRFGWNWLHTSQWWARYFYKVAALLYTSATDCRSADMYSTGGVEQHSFKSYGLYVMDCWKKRTLDWDCLFSVNWYRPKKPSGLLINYLKYFWFLILNSWDTVFEFKVFNSVGNTYCFVFVYTMNVRIFIPHKCQMCTISLTLSPGMCI